MLQLRFIPIPYGYGASIDYIEIDGPADNRPASVDDKLGAIPSPHDPCVNPITHRRPAFFVCYRNLEPVKPRFSGEVIGNRAPFRRVGSIRRTWVAMV